VCGGDVLEEQHLEYRGDPRHMIIGPGSQNQMRRVVTYYCGTCYVSYRRPPPPVTPGT
jgi:hypothetical protein